MLPPDNSPPTNPPPNNNNPGQKLLGVLESQLLEIGWPCSPLAVRPRLFVTASITGYVALITLVIPASTEVKHASFSSLYIRSSNYLSSSNFYCSESRVICIAEYVH